jgi:CDP-diacylglycerol---glycerol-3-phosphate 3-phosphatidyltransferase
MSIYRLKPRFQALLRPLARWIFERGGTANQITLLAGLGSVLLGVLLALSGERAPWLFLLMPLWLLARMALNAIDGMLAREFGQQSLLGAYLNELCDPVSDAAMILPFALVAPFSPTATVCVALLAAWTELAGVLGPTVGASRRYDGPMGKSDRAFVFGALATWLGLAGTLPAWAGWSMPLVAALLALTIINRVRCGLAEARRSGALALLAPPADPRDPNEPHP